MMNDLAVTSLDLRKYVDDTTGSEITGKEAISQANMAVNEIYDWSIDHKMQLNQEKCKEMQICFSNNRNLEEMLCILVNRRIYTRVQVRQSKLLGMTISSDLKWDAHTNKIIIKASKRIYLLIH